MSKYPSWTKDQEQILKDNFPNIDFISEKTGRSILGVKCMAKKFKLYFAPKINIWYDNIPESIRAYIAGHFDGEGCAYFRNKKNGKIRQPFLVMRITNKDTILFYQKYFNGKLDDAKSVNKKYPDRKIIHRWRCSNYEDIYNFVLSSIPFSIEKKDQLSCFKEYFEKYIENGKKTGYGKEFREFVDLLHIKCSKLKRA